MAKGKTTKVPAKLEREERELPPASVVPEGNDAPEKLRSKSQVEEEKVVEEEYDYLRQYQYKKVNNIPTLGGIETDPDKDSKAEKMKAHLLAQPRVQTLIPLPEGSDPSIPYSVTLNGYRLDLPLNQWIFVPRQVADIIRQSHNQTVAAVDQGRIDGDSRKENALR